MTTPDHPHAQTQEALPHTPTPWICRKFDGKIYVDAQISEGNLPPSSQLVAILGPVNSLANGHFIVDCVNQHASLTARAALCDELAEALKRWIPDYDDWAEGPETTPDGPMLHECKSEQLQFDEQLLARHAALAQGKGRG